MSSEHVLPLTVYRNVFVALLVLTAVTVGVAYVDLGPFTTVVALLIATVKAALVLLWFMHVRFASKLTWAFVAAGFLWLAILIGITLGDYFTRSDGRLGF